MYEIRINNYDKNFETIHIIRFKISHKRYNSL